MSSHHGMKGNSDFMFPSDDEAITQRKSSNNEENERLKSDFVRFSSSNDDFVQRQSDEKISQRNSVGDSEYNGEKCDHEFPFTYKSKDMFGCIQKSHKGESDIVGPSNDCCTEVELTSQTDIDSIMQKQMPELKGKNVTGRYIKIVRMNKTYHKHESGSFYLCVNNRRQWQVIMS